MRPGLKASFAQLHRSAGSVFGVVLFIILFSGTWSLGGDSLRLCGSICLPVNRCRCLF